MAGVYQSPPCIHAEFDSKVIKGHSSMRLQGGNMDDTLSEHTEVEVRTKPLEDLRDAFGSDLLALIEGRDVDADVRQRNREFVNSNKLGRSWKLVSSVAPPPISPLVLPPPLQP